MRLTPHREKFIQQVAWAGAKSAFVDKLRVLEAERKICLADCRANPELLKEAQDYYVQQAIDLGGAEVLLCSELWSGLKKKLEIAPEPDYGPPPQPVTDQEIWNNHPSVRFDISGWDVATAGVTALVRSGRKQASLDTLRIRINGERLRDYENQVADIEASALALAVGIDPPSAVQAVRAARGV